MITTVPDKVALAVFRESPRLLESALWIGIIELRTGISRPIAIASTVATALGTGLATELFVSPLNIHFSMKKRLGIDAMYATIIEGSTNMTP